ncbi:MAG: hypothetical protein ACYC7D_06030 [Nitrososphaerales archaeon]
MIFLFEALILGLLPTASDLGILTGLADIFGSLILLVIGILVIVLVVGVLLVLLPAIIVAIVVWLLSGSFFYAGIAFLVVAIISLVAL